MCPSLQSKDTVTSLQTWPGSMFYHMHKLLHAPKTHILYVLLFGVGALPWIEE